jgi:hypothetical protein
MPAHRNPRLNFGVGELWFIFVPRGILLAQLDKLSYSLTHGFKIMPALWNQSRHGLFVFGYDDLFASRNLCEMLAKPGLCLECSYAFQRLSETNRPITGYFASAVQNQFRRFLVFRSTGLTASSGLLPGCAVRGRWGLAGDRPSQRGAGWHCIDRFPLARYC